MTEDDITRMAQEAGWSGIYSQWVSSTEREHLTVPVTMEQIKRFANLVAAAEREACAKVCENMCGPIEIYNPAYVHYVGCAEAIRARGQHD